MENLIDRVTDGSLLSASGSGCEAFKQTPDPQCLYTSPQQLNTYSLLFSSIHDRIGLILLTGEPGIGKTLLLRRMVTDLEGSGCTVFYFCNPPSSTDALWRTCCEQTGMTLEERDAENYRSAFVSYLENTTGVTAVLMDEADGLSAEVLEDIAEVSSPGKDGAKLLQTILASQPRFKNRLANMGLRETCSLHAQLGPLPEREVGPFIRHQLLAAGWVEEWFSKEAVARIAYYSRGRPARINSLCRETLFIARLESVSPIPGHMVDLVASDQGLAELTVKDTSMGEIGSEGDRSDGHLGMSNENHRASTDQQSYARVSRGINDAGAPTPRAESESEYSDHAMIAPGFPQEDDSPPSIDQHAPKQSAESTHTMLESGARIEPTLLTLDGDGIGHRRQPRRARSLSYWFFMSFLVVVGVISLTLPWSLLGPMQPAWEYLSRTVAQINALRFLAQEDSAHESVTELDSGDSTARTERALSDRATKPIPLTHVEPSRSSARSTALDTIPNDTPRGQLGSISDTHESSADPPGADGVVARLEPAPILREKVDAIESDSSSDVQDTSGQIVGEAAGKSLVVGHSDALREDIPHRSPKLHTRDATGAEDKAIALDISVDSGTDEQVLLIEIEGLPEGAALSSGAQQANGVWVLSLNDLSELTVRPRKNSDDDFTLTARLVDSENKELAQKTFNIVVHAVADEPRLDARAADGDQYTAIPIEIFTGVTDDDGSETLEIEISGVPSAAELSAGRNDGNGIWSLTTRDLRGLILTPLKNSPPEIELTVTAIAIESSNKESSKISKVLRFDVILSERSTS